MRLRRDYGLAEVPEKLFMLEIGMINVMLDYGSFR